MAYPNYYQPNYQGYNPPPMPDQMAQLRTQQYRAMQMPSSMQTPHNSPPTRIWVQGIEGARAYLVAPGCEVVLWDSEAPIIYVKSADYSGVPSMQVLNWTERIMSPGSGKAQGSEEFATKRELEELKGFINSLIAPPMNKAKEGESNV